MWWTFVIFTCRYWTWLLMTQFILQLLFIESTIIYKWKYTNLCENLPLTPNVKNLEEWWLVECLCAVRLDFAKKHNASLNKNDWIESMWKFCLFTYLTVHLFLFCLELKIKNSTNHSIGVYGVIITCSFLLILCALARIFLVLLI